MEQSPLLSIPICFIILFKAKRKCFVTRSDFAVKGIVIRLLLFNQRRPLARLKTHFITPNLNQNGIP